MPTFVFDHVGLSVSDLDAQHRFYAGALGLDTVEECFELAAAHVRSVILRAANGLKIELIERAGSNPQEYADPYDGAGTQGYFHWAVHVENLDSAYERMLGAGAREVSAPAAAVRPGMRFAYVKDPEGNLLELIEPARS
jgi:catechol 2,3-dioxygenase-like lactoylglutathione lyase family enzyme